MASPNSQGLTVEHQIAYILRSEDVPGRRDIGRSERRDSFVTARLRRKIINETRRTRGVDVPSRAMTQKILPLLMSADSMGMDEVLSELVKIEGMMLKESMSDECG